MGAWDMQRVRDETSVVFIANVNRYTLPMDRIRRLEEIWVNDPDEVADCVQLLPASEAMFESTAAAFRTPSGTDDTDSPRRFRIHAGDTDQLEVTPSVDGTYLCRLVYQGNPPPITSRSYPVLPALYHRTLIKMAAVYVLIGKGDEISLQRAKFYKADFDDDLLPMAFDTAPNRAGRVRTPSQRLMRT